MVVNVGAHQDINIALTPHLVCARTRKTEFKARILNCMGGILFTDKAVNPQSSSTFS